MGALVTQPVGSPQLLGLLVGDSVGAIAVVGVFEIDGTMVGVCVGKKAA